MEDAFKLGHSGIGFLGRWHGGKSEKRKQGTWYKKAKAAVSPSIPDKTNQACASTCVPNLLRICMSIRQRGL